MLSFSQSIKDPSDSKKDQTLARNCHGVILKGWDFAPKHQPMAQSHFASGWEGHTPSSQIRNPIRNTGWDLAPAHPPLAQSHFASGWEGHTPSSQIRTGWDLNPR